MIFDIEGDGLNPTKIYVLSYQASNGEIRSTTNYDDMAKLLLKQKVLIGHNLISFDIPVIERILGIKIEARLIDTLALSWYLYPNQFLHGLDEWGEKLGIKKPKIDDWENLTIEEYTHRCEEDVKITVRLYKDLMKKLLALYNNNEEDANRLIRYLSFKMQVVAEQEATKWKLDIPKTEKYIEELTALQDEAKLHLIKAMPPVEIVAKKTRPAKPFKQDGTWSVTGAKWFNLLKEHGFPQDYTGTVEVVVDLKEGNPGSPQQVKDWLYSLGWKPETWEYIKDAEGNEKKVEQVRIVGEHGKELCPSVRKLVKQEPSIEYLDKLSVYQHRLGLLKGFLRDEEDGYLKASMSGFTNTLRLKHKTVVNLPGIDKPYGNYIRGVLVARDGKVLMGSDMVSLEDTTKRHYMYPYDPDYVEEMSEEGFDPHLDLALHAGALTKADLLNGAAYVKPIRKQYKVANYSCIYGVGAPKLARTLGIKVKEAKKLIESYWKRNWSIKQLAEDTLTKTMDGEMWLFNPVSGFWYSLRYEKDIFSTLNQSTGVYVFDKWMANVRKMGYKITGQFHDEIVVEVNQGLEEETKINFQKALDKTNNQLILNISLGIDVQHGLAYSEIH